MQNELKDMQERYSEISLKFAEVEGARQQLVMMVLNVGSRRVQAGVFLSRLHVSQFPTSRFMAVISFAG
ncbi:hypothetical protein V6N11_035474 [Hibiscus sabdariffa]|uniref:Uncharacterized protein n=1 Tax=Hibiscus sabdariffa TaxID=183260 RepID=A0ABR2R0H8_9ROSI